MRDKHKWEELFPDEFFEEKKNASIVYWSAGGMEEHGVHITLGCDWIQMYDTCLCASQKTGGIVYPPVPFVPAWIPGCSRKELRSGEKDLYPPSLWLSREACELIYIELMESMADLGFKVCIATSGHYPGDLLLQDIVKKLGYKIGDMHIWGGGLDNLIPEERKKLGKVDPLSAGHGGMEETSFMMAVRPEWVKHDHAERVLEAPFASQLKAPMPKENLEHIKDSSLEFGEKYLCNVVDKLVVIAEGLLKKE